MSSLIPTRSGSAKDEPQPYRIGKTVHNDGDGAFASHGMQRNEIVMSAVKPLVAVLDTERLEDTCYRCFDTGNNSMFQQDEDPVDDFKLSRCSGCRTVRYCGSVCPLKSGHSL